MHFLNKWCSEIMGCSNPSDASRLWNEAGAQQALKRIFRWNVSIRSIRLHFNYYLWWSEVMSEGRVFESRPQKACDVTHLFLIRRHFWLWISSPVMDWTRRFSVAWEESSEVCAVPVSVSHLPPPFFLKNSLISSFNKITLKLSRSSSRSKDARF